MTVAFNATQTLVTLHAIDPGPAVGAEVTKLIGAENVPFISEVFDMTLPDFAEDQIDVTAFGDTERDYIDYKLPQESELSLVLAFHPAFDIKDYKDGYYYVVIEWPVLQDNPLNGNVKWQFRAKLTGYEPRTPMEDRAVATVTWVTISDLEIVNA